MIVSVGIDLHKRYSQLVAMDEKGNLLKQEKVENDPEKLKEFFREYSHPQAVIEATANWPWLSDLLEEEGVDVFLSHPYQTKAIAKAKLKKTDKVDAKTLANLLRTDYLPTAYRASRRERDLRELLRMRMALVRMKTQMKNRVHAILGKHNYQFSGTDLFGKKGREYLKTLKFPQQTAWVVKQAIKQIDQLEKTVAGFEKRINAEVEVDEQAKLFLSIPGMGRLTAMFLSAELGDISRFTSGKQLVGYVGLCPLTHQSAGKTKYGGMAKTGNPLVRWALVETAHRAIRSDPFLKQVKFRLTLRGKDKRTAIVAVARRLLVSMYQMVLKKQKYQKREPRRAG